MDIEPDAVQAATDNAIVGAFAFSREAILAFQSNATLDANGKRGSLIFTSATGAWRGNVTTSLFAATKFATRALSQSLNKEFGKANIHVRLVVFFFSGMCGFLKKKNPCALDRSRT